MILQRLWRHVRLSSRGVGGWGDRSTPPFLILFINSTCNQKCEHCFYWRNLNRDDDLTVEELEALSRDLGRIENLNLSGGEPFLRKEFGRICRTFIRNNGVRQIYVPTNGSFAERTVQAVREVLREKDLELFAVELSLDGMPGYHDEFRRMKGAFARAMETYGRLEELQKSDSRLRIHATSTATSENTGELRRLSEYLYGRCSAMDHHNLAIIRGDRKNPSLHGPELEAYRELYDHIEELWQPKEQGRRGSIVEPMLQWAKTRTSTEQRQVVPCRAGILTGVVYSNGDVGVCESLAPIGNLRERKFSEIWRSKDARGVRRSIAAKECWCTNEVFLWPSIVFRPVQLAKALWNVKLKRSRPGGTVNGEPGSRGEDRTGSEILQ